MQTSASTGSRDKIEHQVPSSRARSQRNTTGIQKKQPTRKCQQKICLRLVSQFKTNERVKRKTTVSAKIHCTVTSKSSCAQQAVKATTTDLETQAARWRSRQSPLMSVAAE